MKSRYLPLLFAAAMAFPPTALSNDGLERALDAYEDSHYAESVRLLRPAAEGGDLRAQEMLGYMHLYGPALYGSEVPRNLDQARYWLQRAAAAGSTVATHGLSWMKKKNAAPGTRIAAKSQLE